MAKTRILVSDRDAIRDAVLAHKFEPIIKGLEAVEFALAEEARKRAYGTFLKVMDAAPEGAFPTGDSAQVNIGGRRIRLRFGADGKVRKRLFHNHTRFGETIIARPQDDDLGARIVANAEALEQAQTDRNGLYRTVTGTLEQFRTFDDLLLAWPEAEAFIKARWQSRPDYTANVPAVVIKDLSALLDLPPELQEAA